MLTDLDARHRATVAKMSRLSGAAFDRAYKSQMVKDHTYSLLTNCLAQRK